MRSVRPLATSYANLPRKKIERSAVKKNINLQDKCNKTIYKKFHVVLCMFCSSW